MATAETVMAVYSPDGVRGQGTGKPDETERLMSGLERGRRKSTERQLADVLLYRTPGSAGEVPGNRHLPRQVLLGAALQFLGNRTQDHEVPPNRRAKLTVVPDEP